MASVPDRHIRRTGDDYAEALLALLPQGPAWPKTPGNVLTQTCTGLSQVWGHVDNRAAALLEWESDPRRTIEILPEWERAWGLPDPCFSTQLSVGARQRFLVFWMTLKGAQSEQWFYDIAKILDIQINISEHAPFMVGISRCGSTPDPDGKPTWEIGPPEIRFYWEVGINSKHLIWFRCAGSECGVDPHLQITREEDLECLFNRWKPAHTEIVFDYSGITADDPMAGTP